MRLTCHPTKMIIFFLSHVILSSPKNEVKYFIDHLDISRAGTFEMPFVLLFVVFLLQKTDTLSSILVYSVMQLIKVT